MIVEVALQGCRTSAKLWRFVKELAGENTRSKITVYKSELQRLRKGTLKMEENLNMLKSIYDNLYLVGSPISMEDLITQALVGLDGEYNSIVVQLADKTNLTWMNSKHVTTQNQARDQRGRYRNPHCRKPSFYLVPSYFSLSY